MTVHRKIVTGQTLVMSFTGRLSTSRGGYLFVKNIGGVSVALLRSDGNSEIPTGYELDPDRFDMLDDGLSGTFSTFLIPPELPAGSYSLCTANYGPEECVSVEVSQGDAARNSRSACTNRQGSSRVHH